MMIDSKVLKERLNDRSVLDWIDNDKSSANYKQGFVSGIIKALAIVGELEHFTEHGCDMPPIEFDFDENTIKVLKKLTGAVSDKIKDLELESHSEKDTVENCIMLMEDVHEQMMDYMEMLDVEHTEGIPTLGYTYFQIVQKLLLCRTRHGGGTSTRKKCEKLGFDSYETIIIGESDGE